MREQSDQKSFHIREMMRIQQEMEQTDDSDDEEGLAAPAAGATAPPRVLAKRTAALRRMVAFQISNGIAMVKGLLSSRDAMMWMLVWIFSFISAGLVAALLPTLKTDVAPLTHHLTIAACAVGVAASSMLLAHVVAVWFS